ncbi:MAG: helix-turn-helix transcriptional regulator [Clostridia bacterium]|nr:helix-turn-helix transcriptional regulator [Clostridia bacterium]
MKINVERLKKAMQECGMTQAQLSRKTGITKTAISQYLSECFGPGDKSLAKIAKALDVSEGWLIGCTDTQSKIEQPGLTERERLLISKYRTDPGIRKAIDSLLDKPTVEIFRAAKSEDGTIAPTSEKITEEQLRRLNDAPETDEEL